MLFKAFPYDSSFCISGEAILGTQRGFTKHLSYRFFKSYLRRSDFGNTTILSRHVLLILFLHLRRGDFRYTTILAICFVLVFFCISGEAILGTQRYLQCAFFPKRVLRPIRVLMGHQRGEYTETHTKRDTANSLRARRPRLPVHFHSDLFIKVKKHNRK